MSGMNVERLLVLSLLLACGDSKSDVSLGDTVVQTTTTTTQQSTPLTTPTTPGLTMEVMIGTDSVVEARYGADLPRILDEIANQSHYMFRKLAPDVDVHFVVVRHEASVDQRGVTLTENKDELLDAWRDWADDQNPSDELDPDHFDWTVLITSADFGTGWGNDGPDGLCRDRAPAAIVRDYGQFASKIVVHELGHALTLEHSSGLEWVMNPSPGTGWQSDSRASLASYFDTEPACLLDWRPPPDYAGIPVVSRAEQCQGRFSLPECPNDNNCERLLCETDSGCMWDDSPPLDGTPCGDGLQCISGACRDIGSGTGD